MKYSVIVSILASTALTVGADLATLVADLETKFAAAGTCPEGSILHILQGDFADCIAFSHLNAELVKSEEDVSKAFLPVLIEGISLTDLSLVGSEEQFVDASSDANYTYQAIPGFLDMYGCAIQQILDNSNDTIVGGRSEPRCVEGVLQEVAAVRKEYLQSDVFLGEPGMVDTGSTDNITVVTEPQSAPNATEIEPAPTVPEGEPAPVPTQAEPAPAPTEGEPSPVPVKQSPELSDKEFNSLACVNQTFYLDEQNPEIAETHFEATNSRRILQQIFMVNQRLLDYSLVVLDEFKAACEATKGTYRVVNVTTLCRKYGNTTSRTLKRINYIGRNFPVCAGPSCTDTPDQDFHIVFADALLTGEEFYDMVNVFDGEYWTCSGAFSVSLRFVAGLILASSWFFV
jgi:hypothetical protein